MIHNTPKPIDLHAFILSEGGSLRLRPLTEHLPTGLVPVGGTPIVDHQIQTLLRAGVAKVTVIGGYRSAQTEQACRSYGSVRYCFNPRYSRGEPLLSSLASVDGVPQGPVLVLRGDLIFDGALLKPLLDPETADGTVSARGRGIGLYRLHGESLSALFGGARDALDHRGPDPELFPYLEAFLATRAPRVHDAEEHPWTRVVTMEDLARALKTAEAVRQTRVAQGEAQAVPPPGLAAPARAAASAPPPAAARVLPFPAAGARARDAQRDDATDPLWLPRPLLRVIHR
jgi:hypothetical protein